MSQVTKVTKITEVKEENSSHALWNLKIFLQGLLVGVIYGIFLYYLGAISVLSKCYECSSILNVITRPPLYILGFLSFDVSSFNFQTSSGFIGRIIANVIFLWFAIYITFVRFQVNLRTVHLVVLPILLSIFFLMAVFSVVAITQGGLESSVSAYVAEFVVICIIFGYITSLNYKSDAKASSKEILSTVASIFIVAILALLPLIVL